MKFKIGDIVRPKKAYAPFMYMKEGKVVYIHREENYNIGIEVIKSTNNWYIGETFAYSSRDLELIFKDEQDRLNYKYGY